MALTALLKRMGDEGGGGKGGGGKGGGGKGGNGGDGGGDGVERKVEPSQGTLPQALAPQ
jgi:hypothetical protein